VLLRKNFRLDKEEYEAISNLSPNTALDMIYKLYEFLTRKKTKNDNRTIEISDEAPLYTKPTASYLAKDRQLGIIVDKN
jgi:site-specific recombinase XerD